MKKIEDLAIDLAMAKKLLESLKRTEEVARCNTAAGRHAVDAIEAEIQRTTQEICRRAIEAAA